MCADCFGVAVVLRRMTNAAVSKVVWSVSLSLEAGGELSEASLDAISVWMADATFGDNKYNYFKVLTDDGKFNQAAKQDTWQQADAGYAIVDGNRWAVEVETLGEWWETMLENDAMKSNMQQRFCRLRFTYNGQVLHGRAINERCYGTVD